MKGTFWIALLDECMWKMTILTERDYCNIKRKRQKSAHQRMSYTQLNDLKSEYVSFLHCFCSWNYLYMYIYVACAHIMGKKAKSISKTEREKTKYTRNKCDAWPVAYCLDSVCFTYIHTYSVFAIGWFEFTLSICGI